MKTAGLILAAGRSSRMGQDKALLEYRGHNFLNHLIYLALPRVDRLVVVLGHHAERIAAVVPDSPRLEVVVNEGYGRGMLSSLQTGLARVGEEADWILWMLVDHPAVRGRTLDRLLAVARSAPGPLVIPRHRGERGHPIMLARSMAGELLELASDASPQDAVRRRYGTASFVDLDDAGVLRDVDRLEEYRSLVESRND